MRTTNYEWLDQTVCPGVSTATFRFRVNMVFIPFAYRTIIGAFVSTVFVLTAQATTNFVYASSMITARDHHATTLLPNGKILVTGGNNGLNSYLSSAELYDPITGSWTMARSMNAARRNHTATLLPNGKVLVAGGYNSSGYLPNTELYDPATGVWTVSGSLNTGRSLHTATLLSNGKVLVSGGYNGNQLSITELYNPANGTWTVTGAMNIARQYHTATMLSGGKVLVTGGASGSSTVASTELYDPATGMWIANSVMNTARRYQTATLLANGNVLVAGGYGGKYNSVLVDSELYDPNNGTWTTSGSMNNARNFHTATVLPNGKVLVSGGSSSKSAELFDPDTGTWAVTGSMSAARQDHTATLLPNGKVLVAGGSGLSSAELFDAAMGTWTFTGSMQTARRDHTTTLLPNGKVLVAGGYNGDSLSSAELFDPVAGTWTVTGSMNAARYDHTATLLPNGMVLVSGGYNGVYLSSVELYDPVTASWTTTSSLNTARRNHTATLLPNGKVLVSGGYNGGCLSSFELFDPTTGIWTATGTMNTDRQYHTATLLPNGKVLVAGGYNSNGGVSSAEIYDPAIGTWTTTGSLLGDHYRHTATLLPNGKVLVAFGSNIGGYHYGAELYEPTNGTWVATGMLSAGREAHTATLLPNGKVLVVGGYGDSGYLASAVLYDPASGLWTNTVALSTARQYHTATLMPNGKVLVAAGCNSGYLSSVELYDVGLGFSASCQPQVTNVPALLVFGSSLTLNGSRFRGISGASGGNSQDSPSDYPVVQLRNMENEQTLFLNSTNWTKSSYTSTAVTNLAPGWITVTMFVNGIPSTASVLKFLSVANRAPTNILLTPSSISENQPVDTPVGTFNTIDPDSGDAFTYIFVSGTGDTDNGVFSITGNTLKTKARFDYETKSSYSIRTRTTDQGDLTYEKTLTITVQDVIESCVVTFNAAGGTVSPATKSAPFNAVYGVLPEPVRAGYTFLRWQAVTNSVVFGVTSNTVVSISADHTLTASWTANSYLVTFDAVGGTVSPANKLVPFGAAYGTLPQPLRKNYTFCGWWTCSGGTGTEVTETAILATATNSTLYAKWAPSTTSSTPVPVPFAWLEQYPVILSMAGGNYEIAAFIDPDFDGMLTWQEYVAGTVPTKRESVFRSQIEIHDGVPLVTWAPNLGVARVYTVEGLTNLTDSTWGPTNNDTRFFRVSVAMP